MDVLLHVENGRPKRPNTDNRGTYVQDGLRPSLSGSPLEDFFTSRMGRISYGHRDIQGIDDGWECATRDVTSTQFVCSVCKESRLATNKEYYSPDIGLDRYLKILTLLKKICSVFGIISGIKHQEHLNDNLLKL